MAILVHGTAVVIGTTGVIFVGPSGAAKSSLALRLMAGAWRSGHVGALVGDDQVLVKAINGRLVASGPETIRGMIELRGSGIGQVSTVGHAVLHLAIRPVVVDSDNRVPEDNQRWSPFEGVSVPLCFMDRSVDDPFAWMIALIPGFPVKGSYQPLRKSSFAD